ncbi:MAG TPA: RND transporter, partial [Nocardioides sp.]|nr:RND transporter [Nocardioides sp.]
MRTLALRPRSIAVALALVVLASVAALGLSRLDLRTSLASFLPAGDPALTAYQRFGDAFGGEPVVVLLESDAPDGQVLGTDRMATLLQLEGRLSDLPGVVSVYGPGTLLNQVAKQAKDLLAELMGRRDAEIATARNRARAAGAGPAAVQAAGLRAQTAFDARYGPVLVQGMPGGVPTLRNQGFIDKVVFDDAGRPRAQWHFLVPARSSAAILVRPSADLDAQQTARLVDDIERTTTDVRIPGTHATVTGTSVIVTALSRRTTGEAPVLVIVAIVGLAACLLGGTWIRRSRRLAPLGVTCASVALALAVFGLAGRPVTLGMVAFCSVLLGIGCYYPTYFATGAQRRTVLTVALASALSLGSLWLSPMPLVRDIGLFLAVGVAICVVLSLAVRPWLSSPVPPASPPAVPGDPASPGRARALLAVLLVA